VDSLFDLVEEPLDQISVNLTRTSQTRCSFPFTVAGIALIGALTLRPEAKAQVTTLSCAGTPLN